MLAVKLQISSQLGQPVVGRMGKKFFVHFLVTVTNVLTGNNATPYVSGGEVLDLTQLFSLASGGPGQVLPTFELPVDVRIKSYRPGASGINTAEVEYVFCPGTTLANGTMQLFTGAQAELVNGNYPAGVLVDVILGVAEFFMP